MRLSFLLAIILIPIHGFAAQLSRFECARNGYQARCIIELEGIVGEKDRLFLSGVHDRDKLSFQGRMLGSTGSFLGRDFHAALFPRVYPLDSIKGEKSPTLVLEAESALAHDPGIPRSAKVKIIDEHYPLYKILGPFALQLFSFIFLMNLFFYILIWLRQTGFDGWNFSYQELRWFHGGLGVYLLLRHELTELAVPFIWSARSHLFAQRLALVVALWSLTLLLVQARFSDRSSILRTPNRPNSRLLERSAHFAMLITLWIIASFTEMDARSANFLLSVPALPLFLAWLKAVRETEWRRALKRSSLTPLAFFSSLLALPIALLLNIAFARTEGSNDQQILIISAYLVILLSGVRMRAIFQSREKCRVLATDCRDLLSKHSHARYRLQALCEFIAEEWSAVRVSVIAVEDEYGMVLASAGPDAIPESNLRRPRRLGPFLRRVNKQSKMLYAPVVEELGHQLQEQGLKHSSLAIPLKQDRKVRAVLCMMADEGERIPPRDASQLDLFIDALSLELLSAVTQNLLEQRNEQLFNIAQQMNALAVENLDDWGQLIQNRESGVRFVVGGDCLPGGPFFEQLKKSEVFGKVWSDCLGEIRSIWSALAASFEFIPKDSRDDFWVLSPRDFKNPFLQELGPERTALLLMNVMEKHARLIASKECYRILGFCGARIVGGALSLRQGGWNNSALELDHDQFSFLLELKQLTLPGTVLFKTDAAKWDRIRTTAFTCRPRPWTGIPEREIFSILSVTADKKETKKLESLALGKVRDLMRRAG